MDDVRLFYRSCRIVCRWSAVLMFKIRHVGTRHVPRKGPALLVSNHQSFMDPPLVGMPLSRECCFMARDSLFRNPLFAWLIVKLNAFPVSRNTADISAIKKSLRLLKQGKIVVLFPEGTRTNNGKIQPMLPGFCGIAKKTKVPIIPTLIDGAFQAWPRNRLLPRPGRIIVEYAPPIRPNQYQNLTAEQMMEQIRNRIIAMQYDWHSRLPQQRLQWYGSCNEQNDIIRS